MKATVRTSWLLLAALACGIAAARAQEPAGQTEARPAWVDGFLSRRQAKLTEARRLAELIVEKQMSPQRQSASERVAALEKRIADVNRAIKKSKNAGVIEKAKTRLASLERELAAANSAVKEVAVQIESAVSEKLHPLVISPTLGFVKLDPNGLKIGDAGTLPTELRDIPDRRPNVIVAEVLDEQSILAIPVWEVAPADFDPFQQEAFKNAVAKLDRGEDLGKHEIALLKKGVLADVKDPVYVVGINTDGVRERTTVELEFFFAVVDTREGPTKGGRRKPLFVLEPIDLEVVKEIIADELRQASDAGQDG